MFSTIQRSILFIFIIVATFVFGACETVNTVKTVEKPQTPQEMLLYGFAQIHLVDSNLGRIAENPKSLEGNTNQAITFLITDKIVALTEKMISNDLILMRKDQTQTAKLYKKYYLAQPGRLEKALAKFPSGKLRVELIKVNIYLKKAENQLFMVNNALSAAKLAGSDCVIKIDNLDLPCESATDHILAVLLEMQQTALTGE